VAEPVVRVQPPAHHAVPGRDVRGFEEGVVIVDLIEEFPGEEVLAIAIARHEIAKPLLIELLRRRVGEEVVRNGTRAAVCQVIWVLGPVIVTAPVVGRDFEHPVIIQA